jgi:hypothetical protein
MLALNSVRGERVIVSRGNCPLPDFSHLNGYGSLTNTLVRETEDDVQLS